MHRVVDSEAGGASNVEDNLASLEIVAYFSANKKSPGARKRFVIQLD